MRLYLSDEGPLRCVRLCPCNPLARRDFTVGLRLRLGSAAPEASPTLQLGVDASMLLMSCLLTVAPTPAQPRSRVTVYNLGDMVGTSTPEPDATANRTA